MPQSFKATAVQLVTTPSSETILVVSQKGLYGDKSWLGRELVPSDIQVV